MRIVELSEETLFNTDLRDAKIGEIVTFNQHDPSIDKFGQRLCVRPELKPVSVMDFLQYREINGEYPRIERMPPPLMFERTIVMIDTGTKIRAWKRIQ